MPTGDSSKIDPKDRKERRSDSAFPLLTNYRTNIDLEQMLTNVAYLLKTNKSEVTREAVTLYCKKYAKFFKE